VKNIWFIYHVALGVPGKNSIITEHPTSNEGLKSFTKNVSLIKARLTHFTFHNPQSRYNYSPQLNRLNPIKITQNKTWSCQTIPTSCFLLPAPNNPTNASNCIFHEHFIAQKTFPDEWSCVYVSDHLIASRANVTFSIQTYIKTYKLISHNDHRLARINNDHRCRKAEQRERKSRLIQWNRTPNSA